MTDRITDPARLLPLKSVVPYWVESDRREAQFYKMRNLRQSIVRLLRNFFEYGIIMPHGIDKCPYPWEEMLSNEIIDAFVELEDDIDDALYKFEKIAVPNSWALWELIGCDEAEYAQVKIEKRFVQYRDFLRSDFHLAVRSIHLLFGEYDDLPF